MGTLPQNFWRSNEQYANAEMESVSRYAREAQIQAQIAAADRGQGNRDPYGVGTGSSGSFSIFFGKPYGGRRSRKLKQSKKSRKL